MVKIKCKCCGIPMDTLEKEPVCSSCERWNAEHHLTVAQAKAVKSPEATDAEERELLNFAKGKNIIV
jgi:hypothetical protein